MRQYIRHPADIPIEIIKDECAEKNGQVLENISLGGLACQSDEHLEAGTVVTVRINLVKPAFEATGQVVWCRQANGKYEVGIQYEGESDSFRLQMVEQICHIEHYRNEVRELEGRHISGEEAAQEWIERYAENFSQSSI